MSKQSAQQSAQPVRVNLDDTNVATSLAQLSAGDFCLLSGTMFTARDAAHMRLLKELDTQGNLPYDLAGKILFYAGPTPPAQGQVFGAVGPTTSSRMDFATPQLFAAGVKGAVGKGSRSQAVVDACKQHGCVYFVAVGGAAAELATHVKSSELIAYEDLGTEAIRKITVEEFPVFVAIDTNGHDLLREIVKGGAR